MATDQMLVDTTHLRAMGKVKKRWRSEDVAKAIKEEAQGAKIVDLVAKYHIPDKTLRRKIKRHKDGMTEQRPGPAPVLGRGAENDLRAWVVGMQQQGYPVSRDTLIIKANEVYSEIYGNLRSAGGIGRGWCYRFLARYPSLTLRMAQIIRRSRNAVSMASTQSFFYDMMSIVAGELITADRMFNIDETGFAQRANSTKVIAVSGSKNVWSKAIEASFHLTVAACASADGTVVPPVFVIPGQRLSRDVMDQCQVEGAKVTTAAKGFVNSEVFILWLDHFAEAVPSQVKRPLLVIHDGCSSHKSKEIADKATSLGIVLLALPPNATHLYQPLDVSVFKPFKQVLKVRIHDFMITTGKTTMTKKDAIAIASTAWISGVQQRPANVIAGFKTTGLFPPSLPQMERRLSFYKAGGLKKEEELPVWLKAREQIRTEILSLPPQVPSKGRQRSTIDVNSRLWTNQELYSHV